MKRNKRNLVAKARGSMDILEWFSLTAMINEIQGPQYFLKNLLFPRDETFGTEVLEVTYLEGEREMAPFVRKNGEALLVEGLGFRRATVEAPNIRIKRPFTPSELLFGRKATNVIVPSPAQQISELEAHVARDLAYMEDQIRNAEEWLAAQALQGVIQYEVADEEVFTITFPKPAANTYALSTPWDDATSRPEVDFLDVKRILNAGSGLAPTHVILSQEAATAFLGHPRVEQLLDNRRIQAGNQLYTTQFDMQGALYLGDFSGVQVWEYSRGLRFRGMDVPLIRPNFAEFVAAVPAAEWLTMYGGIPDQKALDGRIFKGRRFSKSWDQEDPSVKWVLAHSRPLCIPRRPAASVSVQVLDAT